jgi:lipopolysaccharide transport system ATP-binding protein
MAKAIQVENLSKQYRLGQIGTGSLAHDVNRWWHSVRGKEDPYLKIGEANDRSTKGVSDYVWSLRDINFEIEQGDSVGIIGRNGAGKSTLLKILSRVTAPSTGNLKVKGRIASLLEVGTGFHPDLSGRDNIYLNGAILGMRKHEIKRKFGEIVDFAGVERYIDTPVKRYSSGMYVRLAFAVAAYLESEILIVDEVLAVGDAEFQKKCLGKMGEVSRGEGRTILFVSHNMAAVKTLCTKGIVLKNGHLAFSGTNTDAINYYQNSGDNDASFNHTGSLEDAPGNSNIKLIKFEIQPLSGEAITISSGSRFELTFFNQVPDINLDVTFELKTLDETIVFHNGSIVTEKKDSRVGYYSVTGVLDPYILNSGIYKFRIIFGQSQRYLLFEANDLIQFEVMNESKANNSNQFPGVVLLQIPYEIHFNEQLYQSLEHV